MKEKKEEIKEMKEEGIKKEEIKEKNEEEPKKEKKEEIKEKKEEGIKKEEKIKEKETKALPFLEKEGGKKGADAVQVETPKAEKAKKGADAVEMEITEVEKSEKKLGKSLKEEGESVHKSSLRAGDSHKKVDKELFNGVAQPLEEVILTKKDTHKKDSSALKPTESLLEDQKLQNERTERVVSKQKKSDSPEKEGEVKQAREGKIEEKAGADVGSLAEKSSKKSIQQEPVPKEKKGSKKAKQASVDVDDDFEE